MEMSLGLIQNSADHGTDLRWVDGSKHPWEQRLGEGCVYGSLSICYLTVTHLKYQYFIWDDFQFHYNTQDQLLNCLKNSNLKFLSAR